MTALQNSVSLRMGKATPGLRTGGGNARTTRSAAWQGQQTKVFGRFVQRGVEPDIAIDLFPGSSIVDVFGIVEDDKYQQNAAGTHGTIEIQQGEPLSIMTYGSMFAVTSDNFVGFGGDVYISTRDDDSRGTLTNNGDGILVGGPLFAQQYPGVPPIVAVYDAQPEATENGFGLIEIQFNHV